jgi:hypothetical protein
VGYLQALRYFTRAAGFLRITAMPAIAHSITVSDYAMLKRFLLPFRSREFVEVYDAAAGRNFFATNIFESELL